MADLCQDISAAIVTTITENANKVTELADLAQIAPPETEQETREIELARPQTKQPKQPRAKQGDNLLKINEETREKTLQLQKAFLLAYADNPYPTQVAKKLHIPYPTVGNWLRDVPDFKLKFDQLKVLFTDTVSDSAKSIIIREMSSKGGAWLAVKWLETHDSEWKPSMQLNGEIGFVSLVSNVRSKPLEETVDAEYSVEDAPGSINKSGAMPDKPIRGV